jgi:hypothetical protein
MDAMLQLARRPAITGFGFCTARCAASGSRKITCAENTIRDQSRELDSDQRERERERERDEITHEAVALGAAGLAIGDDDSLEYLAVSLEVLAQPLGRRLPRQSANEYLGQRRVAEPRPVVTIRLSSAARARVGRRPTGGRRRRSCRHL